MGRRDPVSKSPGRNAMADQQRTLHVPYMLKWDEECSAQDGLAAVTKAPVP